MPERPGPWALANVKRRLRYEQVTREQAASARYRQQEQPLNNQQQTPIQVESNGGRRSWSDCLLVDVLVLFCFILTLAVQFLPCVVQSCLFYRKTMKGKVMRPCRAPRLAADRSGRATGKGISGIDRSEITSEPLPIESQEATELGLIWKPVIIPETQHPEGSHV
jgi:hypothetical protein